MQLTDKQKAWIMMYAGALSFLGFVIMQIYFTPPCEEYTLTYINPEGKKVTITTGNQSWLLEMFYTKGMGMMTKEEIDQRLNETTTTEPQRSRQIGPITGAAITGAELDTTTTTIKECEVCQPCQICHSCPDCPQGILLTEEQKKTVMNLRPDKSEHWAYQGGYFGCLKDVRKTLGWGSDQFYIGPANPYGLRPPESYGGLVGDGLPDENITVSYNFTKHKPVI